MAKEVKYKIVVGDETLQSEVWTIIIRGSDVYLSSTGAKHTKISLHRSGQAHWAIPSDVVPKVPFVPDTGRFLAQWERSDVRMGDMQAVFYLLFAQSELRPGARKGGEKAVHLPAPPLDCAVRVDFAMSKPLLLPLEEYPLEIHEPLTPILTHQLADTRLLVVTAHFVPVPEDLAKRMRDASALAANEALARGLNPVGTKASARIIDQYGTSGFIEVAPARQS